MRGIIESEVGVPYMERVVGINYDRDDANKHHGCVIERVVK
jgi:hypothetical protein